MDHVTFNVPFLISTTSKYLNVLFQDCKFTTLTTFNEKLGKMIMTINVVIMIEKIFFSVKFFSTYFATKMFSIILSSKHSEMCSFQITITNTTCKTSSFVKMVFAKRYFLTIFFFKRKILWQNWRSTICTAETLCMISLSKSLDRFGGYRFMTSSTQGGTSGRYCCWRSIIIWGVG